MSKHTQWRIVIISPFSVNISNAIYLSNMITLLYSFIYNGKHGNIII